MGEMEKFYTEEQKEELREYSSSKNAMRSPITESTGAKILDALGEQQNTLQNIESTLKHIAEVLTEEKQHEVIKETVSNSMIGEKCKCGKSAF